jgi:hypothetical protein
MIYFALIYAKLEESSFHKTKGYNMEMHRITRTLLVISGLCVISSVVSAQAVSAHEATGLYMNGQWDAECGKCWPSPRTGKNNQCKPMDCAIQGNYHCKMQNPPLEMDDDPRLISLIKSGQCTYAPRASLSAGEAGYVKSLQLCTSVLDKMAGRFTLPANPEDAARQKVDFYLTRIKASVFGSASDQLKLAINYDIGIGTQQDRSKATELYKTAAVKGAPFAQYAIGARYAYGISMPKNKEKAIMWLNKAINNKPQTAADTKAQEMIAPCAMRLIERLTPT